MKNLQINEIYPSFQGEGPNQGKPSIFLRTQFCPVGCVWCDTQYTWDNKPAQEMTDEQILISVGNLKPKHIVFTGGEPFAQFEPLKRVTALLLEHGYTIEFETSGTYKVFSDQDGLLVQYNCSPKMGSAQAKIPTNLDVISYLKKRDTWFKFVVQDQMDLDQVKAFITEADLFLRDRIYLMPQATTKGELEERLKWLLEVGAPQIPGVRVSNRMHIQVWGMQRKR